MLCTTAEHVLDYASIKVTSTLDARSRQIYSGHIFHSMARLDVPTWDDPVASSHIKALRPKLDEAIGWSSIATVMETGSTFLRTFSEAAILLRVLGQQEDGLLLVLASLGSEIITFFSYTGAFQLGNSMR